MRSFRLAIISGLSLIAVLLPCMSWSGEYIASYSGGQMEIEGPSNIPWYLNYGMGTGGWYGGEHSSGNEAVWPFGFTPGPGSVICSGDVEVELEWQPDGDDDLPPPYVLVLIESVAAWSDAYGGGTGSADNDLGDPALPASPGERSEGLEYQDLLMLPGELVDDITISPHSLGIDPLGWSQASAWVCVTAYPINVRLTGVLDSITDRRLLIGQKLGAYVDISGKPLGSGSTYEWSISESHMFKDFPLGAPALGQIDDVDMPQYSASMDNVYFRESDNTVSVICEFYWGWLGETIFPNEYCTVNQPETMSIGAYVQGAPTLLPHANSPTTLKLYDSSLDGKGIKFVSTVDTPGSFDASDDGAQFFLQIVTPFSTKDSLVLYDTVSNEDINGLPGLDNWYKYPSEIDVDADDQPHIVGDSPQIPVGSSSAYVSDTFLMYVMYVPPGAHSKPVAIRAIDWYWTASASAGSPWTLTNVNCEWDYATSLFPMQPEWERWYVNGNLGYH